MDLKLTVALKIILEEASKGNTCNIEELSSKTYINKDLLVEMLSQFKSLALKDDEVSVNSVERLMLEAWSHGMDLAEIALSSGWRQLESLCASVMELEGYRVYRNLRFKSKSKRYEIDIVAIQRPYLLSCDCKRWRRVPSSALKKAVHLQLERTRALSQQLAKSHFLASLVRGWGKVVVIPVVVTLTRSRIMFHEGVPIVPVFKLRKFLHEYDLHIGDVRTFECSGSP